MSKEKSIMILKEGCGSKIRAIAYFTLHNKEIEQGICLGFEPKCYSCYIKKEGRNPLSKEGCLGCNKFICSNCENE